MLRLGLRPPLRLRAHRVTTCSSRQMADVGAPLSLVVRLRAAAVSVGTVTTSTLAIILSAVSLVLACLALGWQVALYLLTAGRPKATLMQGVMARSGAYVVPVSRDGQPLNADQLRSQGADGPEMIGIQVTNHGRMPISIESVALHTRGGSMTYMPIGDRIGPDLPFKVEPGTNQSWYMPIRNAQALASTSRDIAKEPVTGVYARAHLGTGKSVDTPQTLRV